jgi:hypothetical protein
MTVRQCFVYMSFAAVLDLDNTKHTSILEILRDSHTHYFTHSWLSVLPLLGLYSPS